MVRLGRGQAGPNAAPPKVFTDLATRIGVGRVRRACSRLGQKSGEGTGAVAGAAIGQSPLDFDAACGETGRWRRQLTPGRSHWFHGQDLGVYKPGMTIHCMVQEG